MKIIAVIPAGGKGTRSGLAIPKQYVKINGRELISYTLQVFQKHKLIDEIVVSADPFYFNLLKKIKSKYGFTKLKTIVAGGMERQHSVYNGVASVTCSKDDLIVVHDAARPLLSSEVLSRAIETAIKKKNALVCIKAKDTLIKGGRFVENYLNRDEIYYVQTPQIFRYSDLMKAYGKAEAESFIGTDESMLVKRLGRKINLVEGSVMNFKVTTKEDLELIGKIL